MNLFEYVRKRHKVVEAFRWKAIAGAWVQVQDARPFAGRRMRSIRWRGRPEFVWLHGLAMPPGTRLVVRRAAAHWPDFAEGGGRFYLQALVPVPGVRSAFRLAWLHADGERVDAVRVATTRFSSITLPTTPSRDADLLLEVPPSSHGIFLGIHEFMPRTDLIAMCRGKGVEIGPGSRPQVLPGRDVDVLYVEQAAPDQWQRHYGANLELPVDKSLWSRYVVGNANSIPAAPGSLDFVFSSHVLEHLANPLGHLAYWATLLRPGGVVVAVIPDKDETKDFVFPVSTPQELRAEFEAGTMTVQLAHYERWAALHAPAQVAQQIMASGRSIHVHFYTPATVRTLLEEWAERLEYSAFELRQQANHRDFHVVLRK